ncbi:MAG: hypothetical protein BWY17_04786 [Deltaproteobacteria bacterium ADurb.Bin207]|nr:MAG: hypothetical protein BWY17_04786 [Deltaproteobacteria bacterium ADurb.Bin207]
MGAHTVGGRDGDGGNKQRQGMGEQTTAGDEGGQKARGGAYFNASFLPDE